MHQVSPGFNTPFSRIMATTVQCGSRFLSDKESRYTTIKLEVLAVVWAIPKCKFYLIDLQHFTLVMDHHPLVPILNTYTLDVVEKPRLQHLKVRVSPYLFTAVWCTGKLLCIPDALSRAPFSRLMPEDEMACAAATAHLRAIDTVNTAMNSGNSSPQDTNRTHKGTLQCSQSGPCVHPPA